MEFPLHLASRWGGKRYSSFNRVLKNTFNAIEHELEARNTWRGKSYAESARYRVRVLPVRARVTITSTDFNKGAFSAVWEEVAI